MFELQQICTAQNDVSQRHRRRGGLSHEKSERIKNVHTAQRSHPEQAEAPFCDHERPHRRTQLYKHQHPTTHHPTARTHINPQNYRRNGVQGVSTLVQMWPGAPDCGAPDLHSQPQHRRPTAAPPTPEACSSRAAVMTAAPHPPQDASRL